MWKALREPCAAARVNDRVCRSYARRLFSSGRGSLFEALSEAVGGECSLRPRSRTASARSLPRPEPVAPARERQGGALCRPLSVLACGAWRGGGASVIRRRSHSFLDRK